MGERQFAEPEMEFVSFIGSTRARAPSVADTEVRVLLTSLNRIPESSESESDSSMLEYEFDRSLERVKSRSTTPLGLGDMKGFWTAMKSDLIQQTEKSMLNASGSREEDAKYGEELDSSSSSQAESSDSAKIHQRKRSKSWLEASERVRKSLDPSVIHFKDSMKNVDKNADRTPIQTESGRTSPTSDSKLPVSMNKQSSSPSIIFTSSSSSSLAPKSLISASSQDATSTTSSPTTTPANNASSMAAAPRDRATSAPVTISSNVASKLPTILSSNSTSVMGLSPHRHIQSQASAIADDERSEVEQTDYESASSEEDVPPIEEGMDWWASMKNELESQSESEPPHKTTQKIIDFAASSDVSSTNPSTTSTPAISPPPTPVPHLNYSSSIEGGRPSSVQKRHKKGVLRFDNGMYKGDTIVTADRYTLAHGNGTFTASGGETYIGQWHMGKRDGKGIKTWDDGREYTGEWKANRRSGYGILTWPNGDVYIGENAFGFQQGHGMLKTSNGEKYVGEWNVNERHGFGVMYFKNGDVYSGEWKHNKKDGPGVYKFADGRVIQGDWFGNQLVEKKKAKKNREQREKDRADKKQEKEARREAREAKGGLPTSSEKDQANDTTHHSPANSPGETPDMISPISSPSLTPRGDIPSHMRDEILDSAQRSTRSPRYSKKEKAERVDDAQDELKDGSKKKKSRKFPFGRKSSSSSKPPNGT